MFMMMMMVFLYQIRVDIGVGEMRERERERANTSIKHGDNGIKAVRKKRQMSIIPNDECLFKHQI